MNILITGGAGFIGSNLTHRLFKNNKISVIDNLSTGNYNNIKELVENNKIKFYKMDITNKKIVDFIKNNNFDLIYNFACPASPKYYLKHPIETWEASVLGVKNLLDAIINSKTKLFHSSTSEIYGDAKIYPQSENYNGNVNPIGVRACYDEGKRAAEALIYDYIRMYNVDVRVARIFNTYGIKMKHNDGRIISNFICAALNDKDINIYGHGNQTRSFCYVDDTINAIIKLMNLQEKINTPVNIGNPIEKSVKEIAYMIKEKVGSNSKIVFIEAMKDDPQFRKPNIELAKELLKWEPVVSLETGINKCIEYFKRENK